MKTREINQEYIQIIKNNYNKSLHESNVLKAYFELEAQKYGKRIATDFLFVPKFYTQEILKEFKNLVKNCYSILLKIIERYFIDDSYRKLFDYSENLEKMILSPSNYDCQIPLMRMDVFFSEDNGEFKFCEFNTDGTSGMHEEMLISSRLMDSTAYKIFSANKSALRFSLVDEWVDAFCSIYNTYKYKEDNPTIAIVDFLESGVSEEFDVFKSKFIEKGYNTIIADIRDLRCEKDKLYYKNTAIDAVYRRAVTDEIMRKSDSAKGFIQSALNSKTCIIGHMRTQIAHNKILFNIINTDETLSFMNSNEMQFIKMHFPYTTRLSSCDFDDEKIIQNKNAWVIKPTDFYASQNVSVGKDLKQSEWEKALQNGKQNGYILQSFCEPYKSENCRFDKDGNLICDSYMNMTGLYVYRGKFAGVYSRASTKATISSNYGGFSLGTLFLKD